ncbi:MAG: monodechloroaminopyrrolnitrin synthase PrnB family protein [Xanthomonadales bacterium]
MNQFVAAFDRWIRSSFVEMNTELEGLYFAQEDRAETGKVDGGIKQILLEEGRGYIIDLLAEGNTDEGFDQAFDLLGNVGLYMAACRRHDITEPSRETHSPLVEASALAMQLGVSLGVTPRFATSHLAMYNPAKNGICKSFTSLDAEFLFLEYNTRGVFAYRRAADALVSTLPLGISHPVTYHLFMDAKNALQDVLAINRELFAQLDTDRFFYSVRPYYKPYRVGQHEYRGANAGDFAGINEIDLLLGLCSANNISYSQLLVDKLLYMMPYDQERLRDVMRRPSLLNSFLEASEHDTHEPWYQRNTSLFLEVCQAHGETAAQHHDQLVRKFIRQPSAKLSEDHLKHITASGPPLSVLLNSLEKLRDLRMAADRDDIPSRHADFQRLRDSLRQGIGTA